MDTAQTTPGRRIELREVRYEVALQLVEDMFFKVEALRTAFEDEWEPPDACSEKQAKALQSLLNGLNTEVGGLGHAVNVALYVDVDSLLWEHHQNRP